MQLQQFLDDTTKTLFDAGIATARLDVLVLLEDVLAIPRANLLAHPELPIPPPQLRKLNKYIVQRKMHVPLAYIRGRAPFFGRDFVVNTHVLIPRPETEDMIEALQKLPASSRSHIADVGCGSGCIGITAALEIPGANVTLIDIDPTALAVARQNARILAATVIYAQQDLLTTSSPHDYDVVLANLPYVPDRHPINQAARHEPELALFAGTDGLDLYRRLWDQLSIVKPLYVLTESLQTQHKELAGLAVKAGYQVVSTEGLVQVFTLLELPQA